MTTVAEALRTITGVSFRTEQTGGGCAALVGTFEGGLTMVLTDEFTTAPDWTPVDEETGGVSAFTTNGTTVGVYAPGTWEDENGSGQHEPVATVDSDESLTPATLERIVWRALSEAVRR